MGRTWRVMGNRWVKGIGKELHEKKRKEMVIQQGEWVNEHERERKIQKER